MPARTKTAGIRMRFFIRVLLLLFILPLLWEAAGITTVHHTIPPLFGFSDGSWFLLEKGTQGTDYLYRQDDHVDQKNAKQHHHGILLHLLWALGGLFL